MLKKLWLAIALIMILPVILFIETVKGFLAALGIGPNRLNTVTYGEERPVAMGHDEVSWAKNRRAQFVIN